MKFPRRFAIVLETSGESKTSECLHYELGAPASKGDQVGSKK